MPRMNVTRVLRNPAFAERAQIIRRTQSVNGYGEVSVTESTLDIVAVITAGSQPGMQRDPEGEREPNTLTIHTTTRLIGPADGFQPDHLMYGGRRFIVTRVYDWTHYGPGFVSAECSSIDYLEDAPA